jgi:hypothetical protein
VDEEGIGQPTPAHVAAQSVAAQSGDEGGLRVPLELGAARAFRPATTKPQASALQYGTSDRTYQSDLVIYITFENGLRIHKPRSRSENLRGAIRVLAHFCPVQFRSSGCCDLTGIPTCAK